MDLIYLCVFSQLPEISAFFQLFYKEFKHMCTHSNAENIFVQLGFCKLAQIWKNSVAIKSLPPTEDEWSCLCLPCQFFFACYLLNFELPNKDFFPSHGPSVWFISFDYSHVFWVRCLNSNEWFLFCTSILLSHVVSELIAVTYQILCHVNQHQPFFLKCSAPAHLQHHHHQFPLQVHQHAGITSDSESLDVSN